MAKAPSHGTTARVGASSERAGAPREKRASRRVRGRAGGIEGYSEVAAISAWIARAAAAGSGAFRMVRPTTR